MIQIIKKIKYLPDNIDEFIKNLPFQNYHRHSSYSNTSTPDSGTLNKYYVDRAKELGHKIISSCEHGFQGNYWEVYDLSEQIDEENPNDYKLKFIFGAEAYWVKNRFEADRTNSHICIFAKNEKGRRAINNILSEANETGYYYKPRLDEELILSLPSDDVFITTACVAFWKYDIIYTANFIKKLNEKFKKNFMLEVQYHNTKMQKDLNNRILKIADKLNIDIIMGCDSHFIYDEQKYDREYILQYKKMHYADEEGWYMDYPDTETAYARFKKQSILSDLQILNAINNTNIFLEFDDIYLNKDVKLPSAYPNLTQEEKNTLYKSLVLEKSQEYFKKYNIQGEELIKYKNGIRNEVKCVIDTNYADYFLLDYEIVKKGIGNGGVITTSGRGSGVSFFTNTLLGFSCVDRFISPVQLYPERFMSRTRILETKSLPDLDLNLGNPEIFAKAQEEILGKGHSYPMIAWGTLKKKSAWKMYAGANEDKIDFDTANEISKSLEQYEKDLKNAEDDEKDTIDIYEYIPEQYHSLYDESEKYWGIIMDKKKHPCGYLVYQGNIREEIGLIKCKSESTKKEYMVALMDGSSAEKFKYVKNDLLKVDVSLLQKKTSDRIGKERLTIRELTEICNDNDKVWDIYKNGYTLGVNQCEKKGTTQKVMKYQPKSIGELTCFIAGIRPSFKDMYPIFSKREKFDYGIPAFDKIIQNETIKNSFIFFQEQLMTVLYFSGIPLDECYEVIKAVSKKKVKFIKSYKDTFLKGFIKEVMKSDNYDTETARKIADKVWHIIESFSKYGYNASHALCMAYDSAVDTYDKAYYPFEFYEVRLNHYTEKGKKDKVSAFKQEMQEAFGIQEGKLKFRNDNRQFILDKKNVCIYSSLSSIKEIGKNVGDELYQLRDKQYDSFLPLYDDLVRNTSINKGQIENLIILGYFEEFGKTKKLLDITNIYNLLCDRSQFKKADLEVEKYRQIGLTEDLINKYSNKITEKLYKEIDFDSILKVLVDKVENLDISLKEKLKFELDKLGYINTVLPDLKEDLFFVNDMQVFKNKKSITYYPTLYSIKIGETEKYKIKDFVLYSENSFKQYDIIRIVKQELEPKKKLVDSKWIKTDEFNKLINYWEVY